MVPGLSLIIRLRKGMHRSSDEGRLATPRIELGQPATALNLTDTHRKHAQGLCTSVWIGLLHWIPSPFPWSLGRLVGSRFWRLVLWKFLVS